jgi:hypothetical protein
MKMKSICGMAVRAIAVSGLAAATVFAIRTLTRRKTHYREIPVE